MTLKSRLRVLMFPSLFIATFSSWHPTSTGYAVASGIVAVDQNVILRATRVPVRTTNAYGSSWFHLQQPRCRKRQTTEKGGLLFFFAWPHPIDACPAGGQQGTKKKLYVKRE